MKKLFGDAQLDEARSWASPIKNITSLNRSLDFVVKKNVKILYPDRQYRRGRRSKKTFFMVRLNRVAAIAQI
jgi:predicted trehalose synthase